MKKETQHVHPLKKVRGLGAAHEGVEHWWAQRMTALAIAPLSVWFLCNIGMIVLAGDARDALSMWLFSPLNALGALFLFLALTFHARLGIQVVIEDYVHCPKGTVILQLLNKYVFLAASIIAALSIVKLHFFGA